MTGDCRLETVDSQPMSPNEIRSLVSGFEACTLSLAEWTHRAHVTVASWYLLHYPPAEATARMRSGIQRFNSVVGTTGNPEGGYHETITLVWLHLVRWRLAQTSSTADPEARVREVVEALSDKKLPMEFYSRERLMSGEARAKWTEPDLRPLPC
jgi:hypothetical protein